MLDVNSPYASISAARLRVQNIKRRIRDLEKLKAKERSFLCVPYHVPPYIRAKLGRSANSSLRRNISDYEKVLHGSFDRVMHVYFDNGLEIRITPGKTLAIAAIYHVHPWHIGRRPPHHHHEGMLELQPPFESVEEVFGSTTYEWSSVLDKDLSAHARLASIQKRMGEMRDPMHIDACADIHTVITTDEATIILDRRSGIGLEWSLIPVGRHRLTDHHLVHHKANSKPLDIGKKLKIAASYVDRTHSGLPAAKKHSLLFATAVAGLSWIVFDTTCSAFMAITHATLRPKTFSARKKHHFLNLR